MTGDGHREANDVHEFLAIKQVVYGNTVEFVCELERITDIEAIQYAIEHSDTPTKQLVDRGFIDPNSSNISEQVAQAAEDRGLELLEVMLKDDRDKIADLFLDSYPEEVAKVILHQYSEKKDVVENHIRLLDESLDNDIRALSASQLNNILTSKQHQYHPDIRTEDGSVNLGIENSQNIEHSSSSTEQQAIQVDEDNIGTNDDVNKPETGVDFSTFENYGKVLLDEFQMEATILMIYENFELVLRHIQEKHSLKFVEEVGISTTDPQELASNHRSQLFGPVMLNFGEAIGEIADEYLEKEFIHFALLTGAAYVYINENSIKFLDRTEADKWVKNVESGSEGMNYPYAAYAAHKRENKVFSELTEEVIKKHMERIQNGVN